MTRIKLETIGLCLCLLLATGQMAACSSDTGGGGVGGGATLSLEVAPGEMMKAFCGVIVKCESSPLPFSFSDVTSCNSFMNAAMKDDPNDGPLTAEAQLVAKKTAIYDGAQAAKCLAAMKNLKCSALGGDPLEGQAECDSVFTGTVASGGACTHSEECVDGYCDTTLVQGQECPGTCKAHLKAGEDCSKDTTTEACAKGLTCNSGKCESQTATADAAKEGDACTGPSDTSCASGLFCLPIDGGPAGGKCTKQLEVGKECDNHQGECVAGATCSPLLNAFEKSTCMARKTAGEACTGAMQCAGFDLYCKAAKPEDKAGVCTKGPNKDEPCGMTAPICWPYLETVCDMKASKCVAAPKAGEDCVESFMNQCGLGLKCDKDKKCNAPPTASKEGEACDATSDPTGCAKGLYCDSGTSKCVAACPAGK